MRVEACNMWITVTITGQSSGCNCNRSIECRENEAMENVKWLLKYWKNML